MIRRTLTAIDLFSGAGGLSEGFRQAGFHIAAANDFDSYSAETFVVNHPEAVFVPGPIQDIEARSLLDATGLSIGELDVLLGGPPCQAYSVYNHQRGMHDDRSGLFREYLRIVEGLQPRFVVIENVTGIFSVAGGHAVDQIKAGLRDLGYSVDVQTLKAEQYGVPQERRRVFFIASREGADIRFPLPTHGFGLGPVFGGTNEPLVTVRDAIGDLPALSVGEGTELAPYTAPPYSAFQYEMRRNSGQVWNHVAPNLQAINLERMKHIPQGGSWRDIPTDLLPTGMKAAKRSDHTKRYGRLHPDGLASTILTKCDIHWGAYIHPDQDRSITVREAARFQTFPDRFRFLGPRVEQYRQVGNAVPPLLARAVAQAILEMDAEVERREEVSLAR